jgi:hypothetical protein
LIKFVIDLLNSGCELDQVADVILDAIKQIVKPVAVTVKERDLDLITQTLLLLD